MPSPGVSMMHDAKADIGAREKGLARGEQDMPSVAAFNFIAALLGLREDGAGTRLAVYLAVLHRIEGADVILRFNLKYKPNSTNVTSF